MKWAFIFAPRHEMIYFAVRKKRDRPQNHPGSRSQFARSVSALRTKLLPRAAIHWVPPLIPHASLKKMYASFS
jgi:hypothetical protein